MSIQEWWWEFDSRMEQNKRLEEMKQGGGKFSGPEWDKARAAHKEKMNGKPRPTRD
jgi:hypothetical protein